MRTTLKSVGPAGVSSTPALTRAAPNLSQPGGAAAAWPAGANTPTNPKEIIPTNRDRLTSCSSTRAMVCVPTVNRGRERLPVPKYGCQMAGNPLAGKHLLAGNEWAGVRALGADRRAPRPATWTLVTKTRNRPSM